MQLLGDEPFVQLSPEMTNKLIMDQMLDMASEEQAHFLTGGRGWGSVVANHIAGITGPLRGAAYDAFSRFPLVNWQTTGTTKESNQVTRQTWTGRIILGVVQYDFFFNLIN